jgi:hypothetical protein
MGMYEGIEGRIFDEVMKQQSIGEEVKFRDVESM